MNKKQKKVFTRIIVAAVLMVVLSLLPIDGWLKFVLFMIPYLVIGHDILLKAWKGILNRQVFDENFLMAVATIGAILLGDYKEGVAVMLFYQIGELFQSYAVGKSRRNISELMDIRPDYANIEKEDGTLEQVDPDEVGIGSVIVVQPGEKVPIDGVIEEGRTSLNTSALTGESLPREAGVGDEVISGCINMSGVLKIRTTKEFGESTVSKILDMVENASSKKSRSENFISKFAKYYTPIVCFLALAVAIIPPIFVGEFGKWFHRALIFLVVSCPCALVISIPLSFFSGIGGASKAGILVKGSNYLELLGKAKIAVFDKTGTLTKGVFKVVETCANGISEDDLLELAAYGEYYSNHPIAASIKAAYKGTVQIDRLDGYEEISGMGIKVLKDGKEVLVGNKKLLDSRKISMAGAKQPSKVGTVLFVAENGAYKGCITIADEIKDGVKDAIASIKKCGIDNVVMLTGDKKEVADSVAKELGIDTVCAELMPGDKVDKVEQLLREKDEDSTLIFTGDGINDAPVLMRADVGIAMGAMGQDAAIEAADIVLIDDDPGKIAVAYAIARKTVRIVQQNIVFALAVKIIVMVLGALGFANMWAAVFADVGVAFLAIINATRALKP
mgnify:CR=1 FL=1